MAAMPRVGDPRVVVRLSPELHARLVEVAGPRGVAGFVRRAIEGLLDPPVVDGERLARGVVEGLRGEVAAVSSVSSSGGRPTARQLAGRTGLPLSTCERALADGSWRRLAG